MRFYKAVIVHCDAILSSAAETTKREELKERERDCNGCSGLFFYAFALVTVFSKSLCDSLTVRSA